MVLAAHESTPQQVAVTFLSPSGAVVKELTVPAGWSILELRRDLADTQGFPMEAVKLLPGTTGLEGATAGFLLSHLLSRALPDAAELADTHRLWAPPEEVTLAVAFTTPPVTPQALHVAAAARQHGQVRAILQAAQSEEELEALLCTSVRSAGLPWPALCAAIAPRAVLSFGSGAVGLGLGGPDGGGGPEAGQEGDKKESLACVAAMLEVAEGAGTATLQRCLLAPCYAGTALHLAVVYGREDVVGAILTAALAAGDRTLDNLLHHSAASAWERAREEPLRLTGSPLPSHSPSYSYSHSRSLSPSHSHSQSPPPSPCRFHTASASLSFEGDGAPLRSGSGLDWSGGTGDGDGGGGGGGGTGPSRRRSSKTGSGTSTGTGTVLHSAARLGRADLSRRLLKAAEQARGTTLKRLLLTTDSSGFEHTALHDAVWRGHEAVVGLLLASAQRAGNMMHRQLLATKTLEGETALDLALAQKQWNLQTVLEQQQAMTNSASNTEGTEARVVPAQEPDECSSWSLLGWLRSCGGGSGLERRSLTPGWSETWGARSTKLSL